MARTVTPDLWRAVLKGETIRRIRTRGIDMPDCEVDLEFRSGARWRIKPTEGCVISAAMVNITRHSQPISGVLLTWTSSTFEASIYAEKGRRLFTVHGEGSGLSGTNAPFILEQVQL